MHTLRQSVIPAARNIKDYEYLMNSSYEYVILLESHVASLPSLMKLARTKNKKVILHADLVKGLKHDEHATQFLGQVILPAGLISTRSTVVSVAKKQGLIAIQRVFLLDSHSLETSYRVLESSQPDYIEVLPGILTNVIQEIHERTKIPIIAGGFIRTKDDVRMILQAGASAITTSHRELWQ